MVSSEDDLGLAREGQVEAGPVEEGQSPAGDRGTGRHPGRNAEAGRQGDRVEGVVEKRQGEPRQVLPSAVMTLGFLLRTGDLEGSGGHCSCQLP